MQMGLNNIPQFLIHLTPAYLTKSNTIPISVTYNAVKKVIKQFSLYYNNENFTKASVNKVHHVS
jgi:hypothetical protein